MRSHVAIVAVIVLLLAACSSDDDQAFPTGTFWASDGSGATEFFDDGTCRNFGEYEDENSEIQTFELPCKYAVNGNLFTETWFDWPDPPYAPASYFWSYDGENLTFEPWGEDPVESRRAFYTAGLSRTKPG